MGIGDSVRDLMGQAKDKISPDQAHEGLDQAEDRLNDTTDGRFESQLDQGRETAEQQVDEQLYNQQQS